MQIKNKGTLRDLVAGKAPETSEQDKWEYMTVTVPDNADLNAYGSDGWELVSVVRAMQPDRVTAFFKKSK